MNSQQVTSNFLTELRTNLRLLQVQKGLKASGLSAENLRIVTNPDGGDLLGDAYWQQQESGRRPGKVPNVQAIYDWLSFKKYGLQWETEKQRRSMAWAIAINQKKKGSHTHRTRPTGVLSEVLNQKTIERFSETIRQNAIKDITSAFNQTMNNGSN